MHFATKPWSGTRLSLGVSSIVLCGASLAGAQTVSVVPLVASPSFDTQGVGPLYVQSISSNGNVTGWYKAVIPYNGTKPYFSYAFSGTITNGVANLHTLGTENTTSPNDRNVGTYAEHSWGFGINSSGTMTGTTDGTNDPNGETWDIVTGGQPGVVINSIGTLATNGNYAYGSDQLEYCYGAAITNSGVIVGGSATAADGMYDGTDAVHAYVYDPSQAVPYTDLTGQNQRYSSAYAISSDGTKVVGFQTANPQDNDVTATNSQSMKQAMLWTKNTDGTWSAGQGLGALSAGRQSIAYGVNNNGFVVGVSEASSTGGGVGQFAFVYDPVTQSVIPLTSTFTSGTSLMNSPIDTNFLVFSNPNPSHDLLSNDIGGSSVSSEAEAINNENQIVGFYNDPLGHRNGTSAFLATVDNAGDVTITDLNNLLPANSGWILTEATGINDAGQVVGWGTYNGAQESWELTLPATAVPEPAGVLGALVAAAGLLGRPRRRQPLVLN